MKNLLHSCSFILLSDIMADFPSFRGPFDEAEHNVTFGDANRTMVSPLVFQEMLDCLETEHISEGDDVSMQFFMQDLMDMEENIGDVYVDLEN